MDDKAEDLLKRSAALREQSARMRATLDEACKRLQETLFTAADLVGQAQYTVRRLSDVSTLPGETFRDTSKAEREDDSATT